MTIEVSYGGKSAPYAVYVHEDMTKFHPHGQAKFLEEPARRYADEIVDKVVEMMGKKKKRGIREALIEGANVLLKYSLPLVPVDTGVLKNSHELAFR